MTQHEQIEQYIADFGSITPMQAFSDLGITKLATRISEMRKRGYKCNISTIESRNRYGKTIRYAKYSKAEE